jgi:hypothetical protein
MSLARLFQDAAQLGRSLAGDLFALCTYQPAPEQIGYDPQSGRPVWHFTPPAVPAVPLLLAAYTATERLNSTIQDRDARGLIAAGDVPAVTPKVGDLLRGADARVWQVVRVVEDPARALWDLQLRPFALGWPPEWP